MMFVLFILILTIILVLVEGIVLEKNNVFGHAQNRNSSSAFHTAAA